MTEQEMQKADVPSFTSVEELSGYITGLLTQEHDYGTCVYAMSMAATAAFNLVAHKLGVTGFQAGCADMDILRRTRCIEGPFMLVNFENHMYPQYDLVGRVQEALNEQHEWFKTQAEKYLAEKATPEFSPHPEVLAHWKRLAGIEVQ